MIDIFAGSSTGHLREAGKFVKLRKSTVRWDSARDEDEGNELHREQKGLTNFSRPCDLDIEKHLCMDL